VTFNVGRVAEVTTTSVLLSQALLGGAPAMGASAQVVVAFVDREGGSYFQEWSALFVAEEDSGGRVCFHYPRLGPNPTGVVSSSNARGTSARGTSREGMVAIEGSLSSISLRASFLALPFNDPNDGQTVLCYRSYFPARLAEAY
jgi:hypothetical protein